VVLDIGVHWVYSAMAMRRHGYQAKIVSIEAMKPNLKNLAALKKLDTKYDFVHAGATHSQICLTFYVPAGYGYANTGSSSTVNTLSDQYAFIQADLVATYPAAKLKTDCFQLIKQTSPGCRIDYIVETLGVADGARPVKVDVKDTRRLPCAVPKG